MGKMKKFQHTVSVERYLKKLVNLKYLVVFLLPIDKCRERKWLSFLVFEVIFRSKNKKKTFKSQKVLSFLPFDFFEEITKLLKEETLLRLWLIDASIERTHTDWKRVVNAHCCSRKTGIKIVYGDRQKAQRQRSRRGRRRRRNKATHWMLNGFFFRVISISWRKRILNIFTLCSVVTQMQAYFFDFNR